MPSTETEFEERLIALFTRGGRRRIGSGIADRCRPSRRLGPGAAPRSPRASATPRRQKA